MAYALRLKGLDIVWVGDGAGGMTTSDAQVLTLFPSGASATGLPNTGAAQIVPVPGGDSFTAGNFNTALATLVSDLEAQVAVAATLARIQGFATGGG